MSAFRFRFGALGFFSPPPLSNAVFWEEEAEEKGSSRFATTGFRPW